LCFDKHKQSTAKRISVCERKIRPSEGFIYETPKRDTARDVEDDYDDYF